VCDEDFTAGVTLGGGVPASVHDVDLVCGKFLALASFGSDDGAENLGVFAGGVVSELDFGLIFLAAVGEDFFNVMAGERFGMSIDDLEFFATFDDGRVGI